MEIIRRFRIGALPRYGPRPGAVPFCRLDGYVSKPIRSGELFSAIESLLADKGAASTTHPDSFLDSIVLG